MLPVLTATDVCSRVLGFAETANEARQLASSWARLHNLTVIGVVCSKRWILDRDPEVNAPSALRKAQTAQLGWLVLFDRD